MPKLPTETRDYLEDHIEQELPRIVVSSCPVFIAGVNRKINTGNFENIDIYAGLSIPMEGISYSPSDLEAFKEAVAAAADLGFTITSGETANRYSLIKEMQKGGRPK